MIFLGFSELKRRLKVEQKLKEKAEKDAKVVETQPKNKSAEKTSVLNEQEISPNVSIFSVLRDSTQHNTLINFIKN